MALSSNSLSNPRSTKRFSQRLAVRKPCTPRKSQTFAAVRQLRKKQYPPVLSADPCRALHPANSRRTAGSPRPAASAGSGPAVELSINCRVSTAQAGNATFFQTFRKSVQVGFQFFVPNRAAVRSKWAWLRIRKRHPKERYTTNALRRAIHRACNKAKVPVWGVNRLRHNRATELRQFGLDLVGTVLGHTKLETTQIYSEKNLDAARELILKVG
jgi:hypothetical protein